MSEGEDTPSDGSIDHGFFDRMPLRLSRIESTLITVLSGAKGNVGDFLITERAEQLLAVLGEPIVRLPNWEPLEGHLDQIAASRLLVIAGGPGLKPQLYPKLYPLFSDARTLVETGVKLVFLGSGGKLLMGDAWDLRHFRLSTRTRELFDTLGPRLSLSTRDDISSAMLMRDGYGSVMTGCPVWYRQDHFGRSPQLPKRIQRIVFTEPRRPEIVGQSLRLLKALQRAHPNAEIVASFHHGFDEIALPYVEAVERLGIETRDVAGDTAKLAFYDEFDLHVGYRVHAGLHFLSQRKPSVIVSEDMRGRGSARALGVPWVDAWRYRIVGLVPRRWLPYDRVALALKSWKPFLEPREDVSEEVLALLSRESDTGWSGYRHLSERIDGHYDVMREFLESL